MKKSTALFLALLLLGGSISGCAQDEAEIENENGEKALTGEAVSAENDETALFTDIPTEKYDGQTFTILSRETNETQFLSEEYTGESFNDSVFERNTRVMEEFDIKMEVPTINGEWNYHDTHYIAPITASIQAGDGAYDLIDGYGAIMGFMITDGYFLDLLEVDYINPEAEWWSPSAVHDFSIKGKVYMTPGDITMSLYDNLFAVFFNQKVFDQFYLEYPYESVRNGEWTYDVFLDICKVCQVDVDGNGAYDASDYYGALFKEDLQFWNFHYAMQIPITQKDADGNIVYNIGSEAVTNLAERMVKLAYSTEGVFYDPKEQWSDVILNMFVSDQSAMMFELLSKSTVLRDMEGNFGILPYPKLDETQTAYHTTSRDDATMFCIPIDVRDISFAGLISEALCQASYRIVKPEYYENNLKVKMQRDEESADMIDILRNGLIYDFGGVYACQLSNAGFIVRDCIYYKREFTSTYKANENQWNIALEEFLANFED